MNNNSETIATDAAHDNWWQTFEAVFGIPFFTAISLEFAIPFSLPEGFLSPALSSGGIALILGGIILIFFARREFAQHGQPTDPGSPTRKLVTTGVFSVSRNPLYLGGVCVVAGIAFVFNLGWALIFLGPSLTACHFMLIVPEERYLAAKFGKEYGRYGAIVYRWFGRKIKKD